MDGISPTRLGDTAGQMVAASMGIETERYCTVLQTLRRPPEVETATIAT